jgi:hypothetical protein
LVQILRAKGRARRWFTVGIISRPLGTAREPDWWGGRGVSGVVLVIGEGSGAYGWAEVFLDVYYY